MTSEEKDFIVNKILNKIFTLKNQNFQVFNDYLAILFRLDVCKKNLLINLKS
jgi:hypothetical protein